jgi:hypothetical protein
MNAYQQGWKDGIAAAARVLQTATVSPPDAKGHFYNAGALLKHMLNEKLTPPAGPPRTRHRKEQ